MPKGQRICLDLRELIYTHHIEHNRTPYEIHHLLFNRDNTRCTLKYLTDICSRITDDEHFSTQYLNGGAKQSGRPLSLDYLHRSLICGQIQLDKHRHVVTMFHNYCLMLFPDDASSGQKPKMGKTLKIKLKNIFCYLSTLSFFSGKNIFQSLISQSNYSFFHFPTFRSYFF